MRPRLIAAAALALAAAGGCRGAGVQDSGAGGHLSVERSAGRTTRVMDEPGRAEYCPTDSLLTIIAVGPDRGAGLAVKTTLPLKGPSSFAVQRQLGGVGTGTAAFRLASGTARVGTSGTIRLQESGSVSGTFDVAVPDTGKKPVRFRGSLARIPLRPGIPASCPRS